MSFVNLDGIISISDIKDEISNIHEHLYKPRLTHVHRQIQQKTNKSLQPFCINKCYVNIVPMLGTVSNHHGYYS